MALPRALCCLLALSMAIARDAYSQTCAPGWVPLGAWSGIDGPVHVIAPAENGRLIIGGEFSSIGGIAVANVFRYGASEVPRPLGDGVNGPVFAAAVLPNGDVVVGGAFTHAGGTPARNVALFESASGVWRALGPGTSGRVSAVAVDARGGIIVGGEFLEIAPGQIVNRIARFDPTSQSWSSIGSGIEVAGAVHALAALPDGRCAVGGVFQRAGGLTAGNIAICDPVSGLWERAGSGVSSGVYSLLSRSGSVYAGGTFTSAGATPARYIARFDLASETWSGLSSELDLTSNSSVRSLALTPEGDLLAAGSFQRNQDGGVVQNLGRYLVSSGQWRPVLDSIDGATGGAVAVGTLPEDVVLFSWPSAGAKDRLSVAFPNTRRFPLSAGVTGDVYALQILPGGRLVVAGSFSTISEIAAQNIAVFDTVAQVWRAIGDGFDGPVHALMLHTSGVLIAGGEFSRSGNTPIAGVARFDDVSLRWVPLGLGLSDPVPYSGPLASAYRLCELPGGEIALSGNFLKAGGVGAEQFAMYDLGAGTWRSPSQPPPWPLWASFMRVLTDGSLLMGLPSPDLVMYYPVSDTWSDSAWELSGDWLPQAADAAVLADGSVAVVGAFSAINGLSIDGAAHFSPSLSMPSELGPTSDGARRHLVTQLTTGRVLVIGDSGGHLINPADDSGVRLIVPNSSGALAMTELDVGEESQWIVGGRSSSLFITTSAAGLPEITDAAAPLFLCRGGAGEFVVNFPHDPFQSWQIEDPRDSARFVTLENGPREGLGVVSGAIGSRLRITDLAPGARERVRSSGQYACSTAISGPMLIRVCNADVNCDGTVDPLDLTDFLSAFGGTLPSADISADGVVDLFDFFAFFDSFDAGC